MYISELKLWNFRKYGRDECDLKARIKPLCPVLMRGVMEEMEK